MEDQSSNSTEQKPQQTVSENSEKKAKKAPSVKILFSVFIVLVLMGGMGAGWFYGYRSINKLDKDIDSLKEESKETRTLLTSTEDLAKRNDDRVNKLASQVTSSSDNYVVQAPVYATTTVEKVLEDKNSALEDGFRFLLIDVKLVNNNQGDVYFSTGELKLKDSDNFEYSFYYQGQYNNDFVKKDSKVLFLENRIPLSYTYIKPGETVNGTIVYVINRPANKFTLLRNGVTLKEITL